uniref:Uncharacterized protein n=1 Tax=Salix viminalis TaxID=40686 RepID=A0A6N2LX65_SALVM
MSSSFIRELHLNLLSNRPGFFRITFLSSKSLINILDFHENKVEGLHIYEKHKQLRQRGRDRKYIHIINSHI